MKRVFGVKKEKELPPPPPPPIGDASDRINDRGETVDGKIKKLDVQLNRYKEQIKRTRPGPAQEAVKARAMRVLKQKRVYEGQRDMLHNQTCNLDQVGFASEGIRDAHQTITALKSANMELKGMTRTVKIQDFDYLHDEMVDLIDVNNAIQETLGRSSSVPDDIDEHMVDFMSEYAMTGKDARAGSLLAALAEAGFLIGLEKNSDVEMASYSPLFVNANNKRWNPDAIVFNSSQLYGTPSY
ncbi:hypothetical protein M0R45_007025 [Rubus argutus]|uniref:Alpha-L-arabinofuranosidase C-terminal domain-containing protein n=1 Tax=Rubus argutus TaxID=59490 RepID=A0AAW1YS84_RUBAR